MNPIALYSDGHSTWGAWFLYNLLSETGTTLPWACSFFLETQMYQSVEKISNMLRELFLTLIVIFITLTPFSLKISIIITAYEYLRK